MWCQVAKIDVFIFIFVLGVNSELEGVTIVVLQHIVSNPAMINNQSTTIPNQIGDKYKVPNWHLELWGVMFKGGTSYDVNGSMRVIG